ncbi:PRA1 family protein-domain-containing protein [Achaetomium macrosporum]|uniref:PRA1 family protein-domain-containing protein n=1 Tax=Achaetomium macrosporum TaxID=79813 RepID=A0AAN7CH88_9PEZI|nr:PRA1 family protein-domain-containing protein [Achaetomium macrosporum]
MARIQIPIDVLTSRLNLQDRFASMRSGSLSSRFSNLRPISEFLDVKRVNKPANFAEMQSRVNYNLGHFSSNYAVIFTMLCIYGLLTNFWLLFDIIFVVLGMYLIGKLDGRDFEFGQQRFSTVQLYTGLYVIAIPIALISGVFGTMMWLIGASGVVILGHAALLDKPIDEAFSGEARRTQEARNGEGESWWDFGQRVVEELDSDDDFDTQGVGVASDAVGHRFVSDPLRFTGIDLGDRDGNTRSRRAYAYENEDDSEETSDDSEQDSHSEDGVRLPLLDPEEEALADAAMARIQRAQAKGKRDVKLSKEELAAYQRRLQRMEEEERSQRRRQRVAIPLTQLDPGPRQRRIPQEDDSPPREPSPELGEDRPPGYPPMGYFPPPSRARQRSGTTSLRSASQATTEREQSSSPFTYSYVQRADLPAAIRQPSDPITGRPLSQSLNGAPPSSTADPFQYMTAGARTSYHAGGGSLRNSIIEVDDIYASYGSGHLTGGASRRQSGEAFSADNDGGQVASSGGGSQVASSGGGSRSRPRDSVDSRREPAPEPRATRDRTPPPSKKSSAGQSLVNVKRKSVAGSTKSGRKKTK